MLACTSTTSLFVEGAVFPRHRYSVQAYHALFFPWIQLLSRLLLRVCTLAVCLFSAPLDVSFCLRVQNSPFGLHSWKSLRVFSSRGQHVDHI